ncbi:MAG: hypothetical protein Q7S58_05215 [Candidatus Binatus sp.]|uniref:hypothetical protein n=1 Tax=Candidatus Binatus sp. TaxID=2811406 RepID=UPI002724C8B0|nr:hypothetical protein [Candidatus Binatus sp.]MDO8431793.1 hypothetical protein [Candidatus Binatus sp.]
MKHSKAASAVALAAALFLSALAPFANAVDLRHARAQKDLTPAVQQSLQDMLSDVAEPYFVAEGEKKAKNQKYLDLQQKFEYLPNYGPHNSLVVSCKMGGVEYDPTKPGTSKGAPTGILKYLVFTYALQKGKWVSVAKPKWEEQDLGPEGRKKMTEGMQRGEARKAAMEKSQKSHAAAAAAAAAAQKAADQH